MDAEMPWALRHEVDRCYQVITEQPEYLLEHDGGPHVIKADVIVARLYGFDEQLDHEWRLPDVRDVLLAPISHRPTLSVAEPVMSVSMPTARYNLQSNYAQSTISADLLPGWPHDPTRNLVRLLCLRYRRATTEETPQ